MLRVALTGGLGAGKSTAGRMFRALGAYVLSSDEMARELMEPGEAAHAGVYAPVYAAIVERFGAGVVLSTGALDRAALAKIAFADGRVEELNAIVHPAVITRQAALMEAYALENRDGVAIIESALVFETIHGGEDGWRTRFDRTVLVTAPEELKVARFVARAASSKPLSEEQRAALEAEAHRRLAKQIADEKKAAWSDYVLTNAGSELELEWQVDRLWPILLDAAQAS